MIKRLSLLINADNLKSRAIKTSAITFLGFGAQQFLRLLSNLVLTRLLFPEAFGVMALAMLVFQALSMFSDVGLNTSIIQNKDGATEKFRNTAWTLQIARGVLLWLMSAALAYPMANYYDAPVLFPVICALGGVTFIKSFSTTAIAVSNKELNIFKVMSLTLSMQVVSIMVTIAYAYYFRSVWALVAGNLTATFFGTIIEHRMLNKGFRHRILIDRGVTSEIIRFGKWIFLSSVLGFVANQADRVILGKLLSVSDLGVYTVAMTLAQIPLMVFFRLSDKVLIPTYAKIRDSDLADIRRKVKKIRIYLVSLLIPVGLILVFAGNYMVAYMYDARYASAGWMTQILAFGYCIQIATSIGNFYLGFGKSKIFFFDVAAKALFLVSSMIVGYQLYGAVGLVFGVAASNLVYYLLQAMIYQYYGLWMWKLDILFLSILALCGYITYTNFLILPPH